MSPYSRFSAELAHFSAELAHFDWKLQIDLSIVSRVLIWAQIPFICAYYNDLEIIIFLCNGKYHHTVDFLLIWHILIENYKLISIVSKGSDLGSNPTYLCLL